jgi:hypothetical protein
MGELKKFVGLEIKAISVESPNERKSKVQAR